MAAISQKRNESRTIEDSALSSNVFRLTPGCEFCCERCSVSCATAVQARDDLWRQIEELLRLQSHQPCPARARQVRLLQSQMAAAEQEFLRLRPGSHPVAPMPAEFRTYQQARLH